MPRFRLHENRTEPRPDRRLGIKLEAPDSKKGLGGKLDSYVPPELRYEYNPPPVYVRYKVLTVVFVAALLGLLSLWVYVVRRPPAPVIPQDQPIFIEPLPSK